MITVVVPKDATGYTITGETDPDSVTIITWLDEDNRLQARKIPAGQNVRVVRE